MARRPVVSQDIRSPDDQRAADAVSPAVDPPELTAAIARGRADACAGPVTPHAQVKA